MNILSYIIFLFSILMLFSPQDASAEEHIHTFENGKCISCGYVCPHTSYLNGICMECGITCPHMIHNINGECISCREQVEHYYEHGKCTVCGKKIEFVEEYLDVSLLLPLETEEGTSGEQGTVETLRYTTVNYTLPEEKRASIEKYMEVYLPYGYDAGGQYNVLFLCAGQNTDETYWFSGRELRYYDEESGLTLRVEVNNLLDNMIAQDLCDPLIVVSVTPYLRGRYTGMDRDRDPRQFAEEFRKDILPAVIAQYATYADGTDGAEISSEREHFGFYCASYGTYIGYESVLRKSLDLVSWYGCVSGCTSSSAEEILRDLESTGTSELPVNYLYVSSGELEDSESTVHAFYRSLLKTIPGITGLDSAYVKVPGAYHVGRVWGNGLYNCLRIFFRT